MIFLKTTGRQKVKFAERSSSGSAVKQRIIPCKFGCRKVSAASTVKEAPVAGTSKFQSLISATILRLRPLDYRFKVAQFRITEIIDYWIKVWGFAYYTAIGENGGTDAGNHTQLRASLY
ncbi:MAG TPA: hypothetical protein VGF01_20915 [Terracidiphilus sp.]|jgi:hypothetical protein